MGVLGAGLALLLAVPASAQKADATAVDNARALFTSGREALTKGDLAGARKLLTESLALYKSGGTLLNLADCEEKLGLIHSASMHYEELLKMLPPGDERIAIANQHIVALEPRIPGLRIHLVAEASAAATVSLDGRRLSASDLDADLHLDPGSYTIAVQAAERTEKRYVVTLSEAQKTALTVQPAPAPTPAPSADGAQVEPPAPSNPMRTASFVTLGVAGAAAVVGAVTGGLALGKEQELAGDPSCSGSGPKICDKSLQSAHSGGQSLAHASTAAFVVAGAALAGGVVLFAVSSRKQNQGPTVGIAAGLGSFSVRGHF